MPEDGRDRLTRFMEEARDGLSLTWDQIAAKGSTHAETLRQVRKHRREISRQTKRAIEIGLDWRTGSVDRILAGGVPEPLPAPTDLAGMPTGDLRAQIDWIMQQPWSATDRERMISQLIDLAKQADQERRAAG